MWPAASKGIGKGGKGALYDFARARCLRCRRECAYGKITHPPRSKPVMEITRSLPHRRIERVLDNMGIGYISEHPDFHPYSLDLYIGEWHLCIEVDGPGHSPKIDARRDAVLLERYHIPTLRLISTVQRLDAIKAIEDFIIEHATTADERKQAWRQQAQN
jgi:hypothetical protein